MHKMDGMMEFAFLFGFFLLLDYPFTEGIWMWLA